MIQPPENCPRCNSEQKFARRLRYADGGWMELYIKCDVCRWEKKLGDTTHEIELFKNKHAKIAAKSHQEVRRQGQPSGSTADMLQRTNIRLAAAVKRLEEKMARYGARSNA